MIASSDLRSRIDGYCIRSVSEDDGEFEVVAEFDGVESSLSIGDVFRNEAVEVALCGLRLDYVRRESKRGTATAADVRVAIEDAAVLGHGDDDVSDLIEAFMLLASEDELDAWRSEKIRRLADGMDEADAAHRANPRPILVDAETVEVWSSYPALNGTTLIVSTTPDAESFELVVADLLPDDDEGGEEPGEMFKRALKKAEADIASRMGVPLSAVSSEFDAPETITLTRDRLTSALREAAAQGMDHTSGPWSGYAASCREVADRIVKSIETGRFSSDNYHYLDSDRRAS